MRIGSSLALVLTIGATTWLGACGSDDKKPSTDPDDAGTGGSSTGGTPSTGGRGSGGATPSTGGASAGAGGAGAGGADDGGVGGTAGTGGGGGVGGSTDGGAGHPLQGQSVYPAVPHPAENPVNADKAMLGKILFWEEQLGELGTVACGTCHRGFAGGSDPRAATPGALLVRGAGTEDDVHGGMGVPVCADDTDAGPRITGDPAAQVTGVKPPTYLDAMFALEIFWDGRAGHCTAGEANGGCFYDPDLPLGSPPLIKAALDPVSGQTAGGALEAQAVGPPTSPVEMACAGQTWPDIHATLRTATPLILAKSIPPEMSAFITQHGTSYPQMFAAVFGATAKVNASDPNDVINTRRIAFAIATHERRLTSDQTPWDRWNAGQDDALTPTQVHGFELFMGKAKCSTCHAPPLFTNHSFHYIGFHRPEWHEGRKSVTLATFDEGKVKTPTLRNAGLREVDATGQPGGLLRSGAGPGRDLPTVMNNYNVGGPFRSDPALLPLIDSSIVPLGLTPEEIAAVVDFVRNGLTDARVRTEAAPFDRPHLSTEVN